MMYEKIGEISEERRLELLEYIKERPWNHICGRLTDYWSQTVDGNVMFVMLKPGGYVHKHNDALPHKIHTVLETNDMCINRSDGSDYKLELRGVYQMDASLDHESFNFGNTDRIHMVETIEKDR